MVNEVSMFDPLKSPSNKQPYSEPIFISIHKNSDGMPVSKMIQNEIGVVIDRKIVLKEIPDKLHPIEITGYFEVDEPDYVEQLNQIWVDYQYGVIWFHPDIQEKKQITISKYYGVGLWLLPSSRIYMEIDENSVVSTIDDFFNSIRSYVYKGIFNNSISYKVNEMVYYNGSTYICTKECTGVTPDNVSYWQTMTAGLNVRGDWSSSVNYRERDIVTIDGNKMYLAIKASLDKKPTENEDYWASMFDLTTFSAYLDKQIARANQEIEMLQSKIGEYNDVLKPDIIEKTNEANVATNEANNATDNVNKTLEEYKDSVLLSVMIYQEPVDTFLQIATEYPNPLNGWTVKVLEDSKIYRYDGINTNSWQFIDIGTGSAEINAINNKIGDLSKLNTTDKSSLVNAVKEVKIDATHSNRSVIDKLTDEDGTLKYDGKFISTDIDLTEYDTHIADDNKHLTSIEKIAIGAIGDTTILSTESKEIVGAINEVFQSANNIKNSWATVVGSPLVNTDSTAQLNSKTQTLKDTMATNLTSKGQSSQGTESLFDLISKIPNIKTGSGNAVVEDVLSGKTFTNSTGNELTGTMTNRGAVTSTLTSQNAQYTIPSGYHNGSGTVKVTFPVKTAISETLINDMQTATIPAGYYATAGSVKTNISGLLASNIKKGVRVGGILGTYEGVAGVKVSRGSVSGYSTTLTVSSLTFKPESIIVLNYDYSSSKYTYYVALYNTITSRVNANSLALPFATNGVNFDYPWDSTSSYLINKGVTWSTTTTGFTARNLIGGNNGFQWIALSEAFSPSV